jgi:16S rRNA (guanine527-N7)-methyltransferase
VSGDAAAPGLVAPPAGARAIFGDRLELAQRYAALLAADATVRGLIGPREAGRLWDRHLLNSAILCDLIPAGARVVDVGTGAGLPGLAMAVRRPDLRLDLVEPLQRRVAFLESAVAELGLGASVRVIRGRAEEREVVRAVGNSDWVVARAVAPLDRLVRWCLPLLSKRGRLLALKGDSAQDEVARSTPAMRRYGAGQIDVEQIGTAVLEVPTWVVVVRRADRIAGKTRGRS